ncbi:MAG: hypothetical protein IKA71_03975 [Lentisphaeria bacterium]|nr:hypothetical protein [Lentisphaeria bacterium]
MKKILCILIIFSCTVSVKAEPVTMALLAPVALKVAKDASPHLISGMRGAGDNMVAVAQDMGRILLLPLGIVQMTAGAPFGYLNEGAGNVWAGVCAPFSLVVNILTLPFAFAGG